MSLARGIVLMVVLVILLLGYWVHQVLLLVGGDVRSYGEGLLSWIRGMGWVILILGIIFTIWREKPEEEALGR